MKTACYIFCLLTLVSCKGPTKTVVADSAKSSSTSKAVQVAAKASTITPYKLIDNFTVVDTGYVDAVVNSGAYAVIQQNGKLVDTIEKGFGVQKLSDGSYLYQPITSIVPLPNDVSSEGYKKAISGDFGKYVAFQNGKKRSFGKLINGFLDEFSSPAVIDGSVYFWQIDQQKGSEGFKISAAKYDPVGGSIQSHYLYDDGVETDDVSYFAHPYVQHDTIFFYGPQDRASKFSKDFKPVNLKN